MDPALAKVLLAMVEQYQWSDVSENSYGAEYHRCPLCVASENYRPQPHGPLCPIPAAINALKTAIAAGEYHP